jgi:hypothetical protein
MTNKVLASTTTTLIFATAGALAGTFQPASAADTVRGINTYVQDPVSGYVEAAGAIGQETCCSSGSTSTEGYTEIIGAGRLNWWLSPTHTLQVDANGTGISWSGSEGDQSLGLAAHYAWRAMPTGNLAVMGSVGQEGGTRYTTLAVEGQLHGMNWTIYGQGGVTREVSDSDHAPYVFVQGRYYFNPNFAAIADVTLANFDSESFSQFGGTLEFKPVGMPFAIFGRGQIATWSENTFKETDSQAVFGIKLFVNQPTIWSNDVNGATYIDANPIYGEYANP